MKNTSLIAGVLLVIIIILGVISLNSSSKSWSPMMPPAPTASPATPTPLLEKNIEVTAPTQNQKIGTKLFISGRARVFENVVNYRVKDTRGTILKEGSMTAASPDVGQFGEYSIEVTYQKPTTQYGVVEVYWLSPKDGSEIDKQIVYVEFE